MTCPQCQNPLPDDQKGKRCPVCAASAAGKNRLWLFIVPPLLSLALISAIKPSGPFAFWTEISIFCLCSLLCGFALAMKKFKSVKHRIWGTIAFSASGMFLICSMNFMGCLEERILSPVEIQQVAHKEEIQRKARTAKHIAPRDALADSSMLDLSPYYDDVVPRYSDSRLLIQHPGTHIWNGIKFDVRGTISGFVMETNTVAVGKKCSEVYFLHAARDGCLQDPENQFFIHFKNGRTETIPIIYGNDVSSDIFADGAVSTNAVVWEEMVRKYGEPQFAGFFIKKWKNPFPNEPITSIGFASESGFLVAITIKETTNSIP